MPAARPSQKNFEQEVAAWLKDQHDKVCILKYETYPIGGKSFQAVYHFSYTVTVQGVPPRPMTPEEIEQLKRGEPVYVPYEVPTYKPSPSKKP